MITPDMLLGAYANGYFPMAMAADDPELYWFSPEERGVLPIEGFNIPRGLARAMKKHNYRITVDAAFDAVIRACGTLTPTRHETWINETIVGLYNELHRMGCAHSVEVWGDQQSEIGNRKSDETVRPSTPPLAGGGWVEGAHHRSSAHHAPLTPTLSRKGRGSSAALASPVTHHSPPATLIGGLYGVSLGGVFFGESMFSRAADASKIALVTLVDILREANYQLLDTQYVNEHLKQFGVLAVPKKTYMIKLEKALRASPNPSTRFSTVSVRKGLASSSSLSST